MIFSAVMKVSKVMTLSGLSQGRKLFPSPDVLLSVRLTATITDAIVPLTFSGSSRNAVFILKFCFISWVSFCFILFSQPPVSGQIELLSAIHLLTAVLRFAGTD